MIILDTNVISELMRPVPEAAVMAWFRDREASTLWLCAVVEAELRRGASILPEGERRARLIEALDAMIEQDFAGRVLPFDGRAAIAFAAVFAERRAAGRPISFPDCQIAAIARANGATLATRNGADFAGCGVALVDPWRTD